MQRETVKAEERSSLMDVLLVLALLGIILLVVVVANLLQRWTGWNFLSYVAILLVVILGVWVIKNKVQEFRYTLIENELIVERLAGQRAKVLMDLDVLQIEEMGKVVEFQHNRSFDRTRKFCFKMDPTSTYYLICKEGKHTVRVLFNPSENMVAGIERAIKRAKQPQNQAG